MAFSEGHAVVIGVGSHPDPVWSAPITVGDAVAVSNALTDDAVAGYPPAQVTRLHDAAADLDGVTTALAQLADRTGPDDVVLIFFAGHGVIGDDGLYTLATHDTRFSPGGRAEQGTGLSEPELLKALRSIPAQKLLLVLNACLSGNIHATLGPQPEQIATLGAPPTAALNARVLATGEGRVVMTAARATQSSYYTTTAATTVFGGALVDGLRDKGMAGPGYVGVYDLYEYVYSTVKAGAAAIGGAQEPVLNVAEGVGPFPVAMYAGSGDASGARGLGSDEMRQTAPRDAAVETFPQDVLRALDRPTVSVDARATLMDFGGAHITTFTMGNAAGRDMVTITTATAAAVETRDDLVTRIDEVRADVARLVHAPEGTQEDVVDDLRKAGEAATSGKMDRAFAKLDSAQHTLLAMSATVPEGVALSDAVGVLLQRARTQA